MSGTEMVQGDCSQEQKYEGAPEVSDEEAGFLQIFGLTLAIMAEQARQIEDLHWDILDINKAARSQRSSITGTGRPLLRIRFWRGRSRPWQAAIHKP